LIDDPELLKRLSRRAVTSGARFDRAAFNRKMDEVIERVLRIK
jgi:hypothetical protein